MALEPPSSISLVATNSAASVDATLASATAIEAAATVSSSGWALADVDELAGAVEQRARGVGADLHLADGRDDVGVVGWRARRRCPSRAARGGARSWTVVGERGLGDALLDGGMHDLRERPHRGRPLEQAVEAR